MKTVGLLGGMSWESTVPYYRIINEEVKRRLGGLHSAKIILYSVDFQPIEELQHSGDWDATGHILARAAQSLEAAGADCVVLCTNTMHKVAAHIAGSVNIPLLHIADATGTAVTSAGLGTVALLGTKFTMEQDVYRGWLQSNFKLNVLIPNDSDRNTIHRIIYDELCLGKLVDESRYSFRGIIETLVQDGAEGVILGCTEIAMLVGPNDSAVPLFDTADLHARYAVEWALGE